MNNPVSRVLLVEHREEHAGRVIEGLAGGKSHFARDLEIVRAGSLDEARVQLLVADYDAVLMGVEAPELAVSDLKMLESKPIETPILIYGAEATAVLRDQMMTAGAADYLACGVLSSAELQLFARCLHNTIDRRGILSELEDARRYSQHLAHHDDLTGLPNSRLFASRLKQLIAQAKRYPRQLAVLLIDLDRFKAANEALGSERGDSLLVSVSERLADCLRESDTVARRSADEFLLILDGIARTQDAARVANKIQRALSVPYVFEEREIILDTSIGISLFPSDGEDEDTLIINADAAMNRAKEQSGNSIQFFVPEMNASTSERLELEQELRSVIERGGLTLHYQPQVDLATGQISGMEALVRWPHKEHGMIAPGRFIPMAEETGLILPLGDWVLKTACAQNKRWQDCGLPKFPVAVNLSARQFQCHEPADRIARILHDSELPPESLDLELTESTVMANADVAIDTMEQMRDLGVKISIDDFGTGHSSLAYLKRFPIHRLKIDKSFVDSVHEDQKDEAITRAIIGMANNLGLSAIAEGVESREQLDSLRSLGCNEIQGYFVSRPLPADEAENFLAENADLVCALN
ncbi:MAG: diguanylate cyclase (GGDEF)-like protein [Planctomycetota bacterium]|jgi:diguanylate cyclase (GGDEF)-like protein